MPQLKVGDRVQVDISGLQAPGIQVGQGVSASGRVTQIDPVRKVYVVTLDASFSGRNTVEIPFDQTS